MTAAVRAKRLKTGAYKLKLEKNRGRAEFFALPTVGALSPYRPVAASPRRRVAPTATGLSNALCLLDQIPL